MHAQVERLAPNRSLERGLEIGVVDKRGVYMKAAGKGGESERWLAATYREWSDSLSTSAPATSGVLARIAESHEDWANREDPHSDL